MALEIASSEKAQSFLLPPTQNPPLICKLVSYSIFEYIIGRGAPPHCSIKKGNANPWGRRSGVGGAREGSDTWSSDTVVTDRAWESWTHTVHQRRSQSWAVLTVTYGGCSERIAPGRHRYALHVGKGRFSVSTFQAGEQWWERSIRGELFRHYPCHHKGIRTSVGHIQEPSLLPFEVVDHNFHGVYESTSGEDGNGFDQWQCH
jgi:hypothetical protein